MVEDDCTVAWLRMTVLWYGWRWLYGCMVEEDCTVTWLKMTVRLNGWEWLIWHGWGWLYCGMVEDDCTMVWLRMTVLWHGWRWLYSCMVEDDCTVAWLRMTIRRGSLWGICFQTAEAERNRGTEEEGTQASANQTSQKCATFQPASPLLSHPHCRAHPHPNQEHAGVAARQYS